MGGQLHIRVNSFHIGGLNVNYAIREWRTWFRQRTIVVGVGEEVGELVWAVLCEYTEAVERSPFAGDVEGRVAVLVC